MMLKFIKLKTIAGAMAILLYLTPVISPAQATEDSLLIILSNKLHHTGILDSSINTYRQDIFNLGWHSELITVTKLLDTTADYICQDEIMLKGVISLYYNQGYDGFVIIGSPDDIATAYWSYTSSDSTCDPTDLYYADMDPWLLKTDSVYSSYDTAGISYGSDFAPELFFSRICAGPVSDSLNEEANMVAQYFNRIHDYRMNGINLTPAQNQRALIYKSGPDYAYKSNWGVDNIARDLQFQLDYNITSCHNYIEELEAGYRFADLFSHSGPTSNGFGFTTTILSNTDARINFINLFSCSAARFTVENFGATYLFKTDYTLNVTGSTGDWGMVHDSLFFHNLDTGLAVGPALQDYMQRTIPSQEGWPKGILLGDPLITYTTNLNNQAPRILNNFHDLTVNFGDTFNLIINAMDPDNEPFVLTMPNLPPNAIFNGNLFQWLPDTNYIGVIEEFTIQAWDVSGNSFHEEFTIKVPSLDSTQFMNGDFEMGKNERIAYWESSPSMQNPVWELPNQGHDTLRCISIKHDRGPSDSYWHQTIKLIPNQKYILQGWIQGEGIVNMQGGQVGANLCIVGTWEHTASLTGTFVWTAVSIEFIVPADSLVTIGCRLGYWGNIVTGKAWFDELMISIVVSNENQPGSLPPLKVFPNPVTNILHIDYQHDEHSNALIEIRDISGRSLFSEEFKDLLHHTIDVSTYPDGFYILTIRDRKRIISRKIIIRH